MTDSSELAKKLPSLVLPKRFEVLERRARSAGISLDNIVQRVEAPANRIETLLRSVRDGGVGRFELFLGKSGSGKTTFLKTLPRFFEHVAVDTIPIDVQLPAIPAYIRERRRSVAPAQLFILLDRDNPIIDEEESAYFFEQVRVLFREAEGEIVLIWPVTDEPAARKLAEIAWNVGRDSIVDLTRGVYKFEGLEKKLYYDVADLTTRSLNGGKNLEVFGLTRGVVVPDLDTAETIGDFYTRLETRSVELNQPYRDILKDKIVPKVWVLLAGDDNRDLNVTVPSLTQGTQKLVDIDRLAELLDVPDVDTLYLKEWKTRRDSMAYLMRLLNVRLFELPPNVALGAVRAFGDDDLKSSLKQPNAPVAQALGALKNSLFYQMLTGNSAGRATALPATKKETTHEYIRLQRHAAKDDQRINKALAAAIQAAFDEDGIKAKVRAERKGRSAPGMKPDVEIVFDNGEIICLEPTWRTTGIGIIGEIDEQQNTLTIGHTQKYLLEKALEYVKALEL